MVCDHFWEFTHHFVLERPHRSVSSSHWSKKNKMETQASKPSEGLNPCFRCLGRLSQAQSKCLGHSIQYNIYWAYTLHKAPCQKAEALLPKCQKVVRG